MKAELWIDPEPCPPAKKVTGEWRCECGLTMVHPQPCPGITFSMTGRCLTCGDEAEVFPA